MARSPRWAARLEARNHGARGDPPGDVAAAGEAAWMAHRGGRRGGTWVERSASRATSGSASERGRRLNYARRQQYRRLSRAGRAAAGSVAAALLALVVGGAERRRSPGCCSSSRSGSASTLATGSRSPVVAASVLARRTRCSVRSRRWRAEGWRLRHSLPWRGRGDIDSVAISPTGIAVAIETKTRTYDGRHLARVREQAAWLSRRRRRWTRNGALGVMCLVRARGVERVEQDVLVVSIDRLTDVLRVAAGMRPDVRSSG